MNKLIQLLVVVLTLTGSYVQAVDLSITANDVKPIDGNTVLVKSTSGEALTNGMAVYKHKTSGKWFKIDVDDTTKMANISATANSVGVVMFGGAAIDDLVWIAVGGPINPGATVTAGVGYYGSDTAGKIRPGVDNATPDVPVFLGTAISSSQIHLGPVNHKTAL